MYREFGCPKKSTSVKTYESWKCHMDCLNCLLGTSLKSSILVSGVWGPSPTTVRASVSWCVRWLWAEGCQLRWRQVYIDMWSYTRTPWSQGSYRKLVTIVPDNSHYEHGVQWVGSSTITARHRSLCYRTKWYLEKEEVWSVLASGSQFCWCRIRWLGVGGYTWVHWWRAAQVRLPLRWASWVWQHVTEETTKSLHKVRQEI